MTSELRQYIDIIDQDARWQRERCGELIDEGGDRKVYADLADPQQAVKVDARADQAPGRGGRSQNETEWQIWQMVRNDEFRRWFVPCVEMSPSGKVLVQRRAQRLAKDDEAVPRRLPRLFSVSGIDCRKIENWGLLAGRAAVCDYGHLKPALLGRPELRELAEARMDMFGNFRFFDAAGELDEPGWALDD